MLIFVNKFKLGPPTAGKILNRRLPSDDMGTYACFVGGRKVGTIEAKNHDDALGQCWDAYGMDAEASWQPDNG